MGDSQSISMMVGRRGRAFVFAPVLTGSIIEPMPRLSGVRENLCEAALRFFWRGFSLHAQRLPREKAIAKVIAPPA
ncbi:MAG: hypothetical protein LKK13_04465 [Bacilli bacterium]|nr:hypothetical protein [Bacilli bacterium]